MPNSSEIRYVIGNRHIRFWNCDRCSRSFTDHRELIKHGLYFHDRQCDKCYLMFSSRAERDNHEPYCARRFGVRTVYRPDRPNQNVPVRQTPQREPERRHRCTFCRRKFRTEEARNRHQRRCSLRFNSNRWILKEWFQTEQQSWKIFLKTVLKSLLKSSEK